MNNRNYNIYFHTHTISGIIVAALLYVIFFAGSFSFFKDQISAWQNNTSQTQIKNQQLKYQSLLDSLDQKYDLHGRSLTFYLYPQSSKCYVNLAASVDTVQNAKAKETAYFNYDFIKERESTYAESYDLGEFLYRLHFLAQLNQAIPLRIGYPVGYLIAGLVAFLFLFALITGLLLHWDKLVSNFYQFRPWAKWKTIWTDLHTVLGVIGFPFQFVFAFTGVILIINTVFLTPFGKLLYQGNMDKVYQELEYTSDLDVPYLSRPFHKKPDIQGYIDRTQKRWPNAFLNRIYIKNYGDESMTLMIGAEADRTKSFAGTGIIAYNLATGNVLKEHSPYDQATYIATIKSIVYRLHFGDYGGYFAKIVNFVLGVMGCIVIISGIMIWLVARDKNSIPAYKRKFNFWLANIFLAACLTMLPVTAFTFVMFKVWPHADRSMIYQTYFYSWLLLSLYYIIRKNLSRTNRETLLLGALFAFAVPIVNGICTNKWFWNTWHEGATDIFFIDLLWLTLGTLSLIAFQKIRKKNLANG